MIITVASGIDNAAAVNDHYRRGPTTPRRPAVNDLSWSRIPSAVRRAHDCVIDVKCIKKPSNYFNISDFITFSTSNTRSSTYLKLKHSKSKNNTLGQFYFNRIPRLWNSLPCIDLDLSIPTIRAKLRHLIWNHFISTFDPNNICTYHYLCPCHSCSVLPISLDFNQSIM